MSEEEELAKMYSAIKKLVEELSREYNVPVPDVFVHPTMEFWDACGGVDGDACYEHETKSIHLNAAYIDPRLTDAILEMVLHEFEHYLRHARFNFDTKTAFPEEEYDRAHCRRSFEKEAKQFARTNFRKYKKLFARLVEEALR
jgi:Zn-dependent peptidase ImmA (M78 family)